MGWRSFLFSFRGRIGRARFWLYCALAVPLLAVLVVASWAYALSVPGAYENGGPTPLPTDPLGMLGAGLFCALLVAVLYAGAAVTVKRLHDRDKAWWWLLVFILLPDVLTLLAEVFAENDVLNEALAFAIEFAALAVASWGSIELGLLRGTAGPNRYGADPLGA